MMMMMKIINNKWIKPKTKVYLLKLKYIANIKKSNVIKSLMPVP